MLTYQDFLEVGDNPEAIADFISDVIAEHEASEKFKIGQIAGEFYRGEDRYIAELKKMIYDIDGNAKEDTYTPDRKCTANWYFYFTVQLVSHLLGNGISFSNEGVKKKLGGNKFDSVLQMCLTWAANDGEAYGLVTENGVKPLCYGSDVTEPRCAVLLDEYTSNIGAGVEYWKLDPDSPRIAVLYTQKGKMTFREFDDKNSKSGRAFQLVKDLEPYSNGITVSNKMQGEYFSGVAEYPRVPIVRLNFINKQSNIKNRVETLFNYDLTLSNLINTVNNNVVYWVVSNAAAMDEDDDMRFIASVIRKKMVHVEDGQSAEPHQINIQYQAHESALMQLEQRLITDFMAIDTKSLRSGAITTVEINQSYDAIEKKCDLVENLVGDFVRDILSFYGLENEEFHFTRSKSINITEMVGNYASTVPLTGEEYATKKVLETYGDIDEFATVQEQKASDESAIFSEDKQESTIARIAELIFQKLKQLFTGKKAEEPEKQRLNGDDENV